MLFSDAVRDAVCGAVYVAVYICCLRATLSPPPPPPPPHPAAHSSSGGKPTAAYSRWAAVRVRVLYDTSISWRNTQNKITHLAPIELTLESRFSPKLGELAWWCRPVQSLLFFLFSFTEKSLVCCWQLAIFVFSRMPIAVGIARPNRLSVFAVCAFVS